MKKTVKQLATLLLTCLLFSACGQKAAEPEKPAPEEAAVPAAAPNAQGAREAAAAEVENNGGYYVRVNDRIYFRRYGADALNTVATFGDFTGEWNTTGCTSELMALDPASGALETLFVENGCGPLWYGDGGFYLTECVNGQENYVGWYALDGSDAEILCKGKPLGVTESGLLAVERDGYDGTFFSVYTFYRGKAAVGTLETRNILREAGLTEQGLFLTGTGSAAGDEVCRLWQITPEGRLLDLGALPATEEYPYYDISPDRFLAADGRVVLGIGYYAGSGHFLNDAQFVEADVGRENSLRALDWPMDEEYLSTLPYPVFAADGSLSFVPALAGDLRTDWSGENDGALQLYENGAWRTLCEAFAPQQSDGFGYRRMEQHMDYVGGRVYATVACAHNSPMDSVGWRDAYILLDMLYLSIDGSGAQTELADVVYDSTLYGDVWFIEESDTLLWRQRRIGMEDEDHCIPEYAFAVLIAEGAYWEGGREAVFDGETGLVNGGSLGEVSYYGYPVPEGEPAGQLCLKLDRDGAVTALARKAPEAVLAIDFDVPDGELAGAAKRLDVSRRDFDEDTYWFWTKLRVLEDGVRVRVERTPEEMSDAAYFALIEGMFQPGETLYDAVLDRGDFVALRASLPWHPELRVSVSKGESWGSYVFGEDNYLHLQTEDSIHPELLLAAYPPSEASAVENTRTDVTGTWLYRSPLTGEVAGTVRLDEDGTALVSTDEDGWQLNWRSGRLYAEQYYDAPDLLCLRAEEPIDVGAFAFDGEAGDYLIDLYRTDGEEILRLTQANNGDGVLSYLLSSGAQTYSFTLTRPQGAAASGTQRRSASFPALAVRYDREKSVLWLQEAESVGEDEAGTPIRRAVPGAPCLAYPVAEKDTAALGIRASGRLYGFFTVTVDKNGGITEISPLND